MRARLTLRFLLLPSAAALLTARPPTMFEIAATNGDGGVRFTVTDEERDSSLGAGADAVTVRDADRIVRDIRRVNGCVVQDRAHPFPITYGQVPECFHASTVPQPLDSDTLYLVTTSGSRDGSGYFIPGPPSQTFTRGDVAARVKDWHDLSR